MSIDTRTAHYGTLVLLEFDDGSAVELRSSIGGKGGKYSEIHVIRLSKSALDAQQESFDKYPHTVDGQDTIGASFDDKYVDFTSIQ